MFLAPPTEPITYVIFHVTDEKQWPTSFVILDKSGLFQLNREFSEAIWKHLVKQAIGKD